MLFETAPVVAASQPAWFAPPPGMSLTNGAPTNRLQLRTAKKVHLDPKFMRQVVAYRSDERPGTHDRRTPGRNSSISCSDSGKALRYGIGTARRRFRVERRAQHHPQGRMAGLDAAGRNEGSASPGLPDHMPGGINNPLGARALYIGSTLYRIHGTNEPWTIGTDVSSGCIRHGQRRCDRPLTTE